VALEKTALNSAVLKEVELKEQLISLPFFQPHLKHHLKYDNAGMLSVTAIADGLSHQSFKVCGAEHTFFVKCFTEKNADTRNTEINVTKVTARAGLSPKVVYADDQFLITEFIDGNTLESIPLVTQEKVHHCLSLMEQLHQINHDDIVDKALSHIRITALTPSVILNSLIKALALSEQEVVQETLQEIADNVLLLMPKVDKNKQVLCHGDMNFSNVFLGKVINENQLYLLDFECACVAEAEFDIAMMIAVNSLPVDVVFKHVYLAGLSKQKVTRYLLFSLFINGLWYFNAACAHGDIIEKQSLFSLAKTQFIRFDSLNLIEESLASVLNFECKI
jgi:thiamine kinase-like enzyme